MNPSDLTTSFNRDNQVLPPGPLELTSRQAFYHLVNVEEHPEILPLAFDVAQGALSAASGDGQLPDRLNDLTKRRPGMAQPWRQSSDDLTRRQVLHYFTQYLPTALVDGCWLQSGLRVSTAHTPVGGSLTGLYAHQLRAFRSDAGRHFVGDYRAAWNRLGAPLDEVSSHSFANQEQLREGSFGLPVFLLAMAQFTRTFAAEIVGLNLAWQYLDLSAFGPSLIRDLCEAYGLPQLGHELEDPGHFEKRRELALEAATRLTASGDEQRVIRGLNAGVAAWTAWFEGVKAAAPSGPPDPRQEMIDLLWRKAPHATGYHANKELGSKKIDEHLDPRNFDGPALLDELGRSRWVKPGQSDRSGILRHLVKFGGPMLAVFTSVELKIMEDWINGLPPRKALEGGTVETVGTDGPSGPSKRESVPVTGRGWDPATFRQRSERLYGNCSVRDLYYYLINAEIYPDILPIAERFARDRLERSMAMLWKGERPIPSRRYDPDALERWVYRKHREQVESYRPPAVRPEAPKDSFIEASVQLAPLILIDGGWLQGIASSALIHTVVGRMLFHVLVEEIGEGNADEHHANIYRRLLAAMGEEAPPVESREFAHWPRLRDSSFEVPTLWLSISCFPRHFLPEIIGLNLAVELAGIGGPYMEARDTLKRFGYPTLFVDVHNAADNVAAGHSAWAMNTIKRYMDDVAEREGPHNLDHTWHRVWSGVRATMPQIGRMRLLAHRIRKRILGADQELVPLIFPS